MEKVPCGDVSTRPCIERCASQGGHKSWKAYDSEEVTCMHTGFHGGAESRAACGGGPDQAAHCHWQHSQRAEAQGRRLSATLIWESSVTPHAP